MRASEALSLTSQADAAFLLRFVKMGVEDGCDQGQLVRTLGIMREGVLRAQKGRDGEGRLMEVEAGAE